MRNGKATEIWEHWLIIQALQVHVESLNSGVTPSQLRRGDYDIGC